MIRGDSMKKWSGGFHVFLVFILIIVGCSNGTEEIESISIYKMKNFSTVQEDSLITLTDSKVIDEFTKGFNNANKEQGIVNMADPEYKVELGGVTYFLWITEEHGTIMDLNDTHTIYTLSKSSAKNINELLNEQSSSFNNIEKLHGEKL